MFVYVILSHRREPNELILGESAFVNKTDAERKAEELATLFGCPAEAIEVRQLTIVGGKLA